jgi:flagellar hook-associated protein 1 FlgK
LLATSTTGNAGDTTNLLRFAALGSSAVLNQGSQTFSQYANQMVSDIGTGVQTLTAQQSTNQTLTTSITNQQQSVEGVDTNEELSNVMKYQQMFEIAGKYMSAMNDSIQSLISAIQT